MEITFICINWAFGMTLETLSSGSVWWFRTESIRNLGERKNWFDLFIEIVIFKAQFVMIEFDDVEETTKAQVWKRKNFEFLKKASINELFMELFKKLWKKLPKAFFKKVLQQSYFLFNMKVSLIKSFFKLSSFVVSLKSFFKV